MYTGQFIYCGRRITLSIDGVLPLRGVLEGTVTYSVELHAGKCSASAGASRDYDIVVSRNPNNDASARASRDYAIVISRNPDNGTSAGLSRDYAIVISCNLDNGVWAGGVSHRRKAATNDGKADDARHPPVPLVLQQQWPLLSKGSLHHLIYIG